MLFRANARDLYVIPNPPQTVWGISYNNARLARDSSRFIQNDNHVIPSAHEESPAIRSMVGDSLHSVSFRMIRLSFRTHVRNFCCHLERKWEISCKHSLSRRFFGVTPIRMTAHHKGGTAWQGILSLYGRRNDDENSSNNRKETLFAFP